MCGDPIREARRRTDGRLGCRPGTQGGHHVPKHRGRSASNADALHTSRGLFPSLRGGVPKDASECVYIHIYICVPRAHRSLHSAWNASSHVRIWIVEGAACPTGRFAVSTPSPGTSAELAQGRRRGCGSRCVVAGRLRACGCPRRAFGCPARRGGLQRTLSLQAGPHTGHCLQGLAVARHHRDRAPFAARSVHPVPHGDPAAPAGLGVFSGVVRRPLKSCLLRVRRAQEHGSTGDGLRRARSARKLRASASGA